VVSDNKIYYLVGTFEKFEYNIYVKYNIINGYKVTMTENKQILIFEIYFSSDLVPTHNRK